MIVDLRIAPELYSFRTVERVVGSALQANTPSAAALAAIEAKLTDANADYSARRYQDALREYRETASLVYQQLNPSAPAGGADVSFDPKLFDSLFSMSVEWMNVLPVTQPVVGARPRVPVDPAAFGPAAKFDQVGLRSTELSAAGAAGAVADFQMATALDGAGNPKAAQFFLERARTASPNLTKTLEGGGGAAAPAPPQPAPAASGGGPVLVGGVEKATLEAPMIGAGFAGKFAFPASAVMAPNLLGPIAVPRADVPPAMTVERTFGARVGDAVQVFTWAVGDAPPALAIRAALYDTRVTTQDLEQLVRAPVEAPDFALQLPHIYYYVVPLGIAECLHAIGDYANAESQYLQAAAYQYMNVAIEAPYLWGRLATLYLDWGDSLFREEDAPAALPIYENVITATDGEPGSGLYTTASLKPGADVARQVIGNLAAATTLAVNPTIAAIVVEVRQQILKIKGGLDFWGFWTNTVPIWTFEYLQNVAVNFTQLAVSAERDVVQFWDRAGQASLTRQQLGTAVDSNNAEVVAADLQTVAAQTEADAYGDGVTLAAQRAADARANAADYATQSDLAISYSASSAQISGGDDGDPDQLNALADQLLSGSGFSGSRGTVAAATQLAGAKANRQYEIDSMNRQAGEMDLAQAQAAAELTAANARIQASSAAADVARIRAQGAQALLDAFDEQFFTADVWQRMGDAMYRLYRRYLAMALRAARLMQQAYNFETDQALRLIRADYSTDEIKGLLGADALLADIESFTYDLITSRAGKPQPVKQTISLANRYAFAFENQLRPSGTIDFETGIDDFDSVYPGTFAGRIEAVEVEIDGIVPPTGISGTLTNSGISSYRLPNRLWPAGGTSGLKHRVQSRETLVLSDYQVRQDALLATTDARMLRIFQGAGVASSWHLELPKDVNDLDFGSLLDVRLVFYYKARFDPDLAARVTTELATRPGFVSRQRALPLRWLYPDAFFAFQDTGQLSFSLGRADFRTNETVPVLESVGLLVVTDGSVPANGLVLSVATPAVPAGASGTTDGTGAIGSAAAGNPFAALSGGTALGPYVVGLAAAQNPALAPGGKLDLGPIVNLSLLMGYSFTPRS